MTQATSAAGGGATPPEREHRADHRARDALARRVARAGPLAARLDLAPPPADAVVLDAARLLGEPDHLAAAVARAGRALEAPDHQVAASLWSKYYAAPLLTGGLAAMTAGGIGLDLSAARVVVVEKDGLPHAAHLVDAARGVVDLPERAGPDAEAVPGARTARDARDLRRHVLDSAFLRHVEPLFGSLRAITGVSPAVLWGNVGNLLAWVFDQLADDARSRVGALDDRAAVLAAADAPWRAGPNPLRDPVRYEHFDEPGVPLRVQVRRTCCLRYRLPPATCCNTCPLLDREERLALLKAREAK